MSRKIEFRPRSGKWHKVNILADTNRDGTKVTNVQMIIGSNSGDRIVKVIRLDRHDIEWIRDAMNELFGMEGPDYGSDNSVPDAERA